ncbi:MAG: thiamine-phosphate kinase [Candidatus Bathyarchaeota archaeon]|nr:thiamine-phosphate kinase [Candidatus Bathyarchaeota archaeon]
MNVEAKVLGVQEPLKASGESVEGLGEHAVIELMRGYFEVMPDVAVPFGDDVSALPLGGGDVAVLKADMLVAKTDVPRGMSLWQAARKAVVMNVSDFASKGVAPRAVMVSLGLPAGLRRDDLVEIAKGLNAGAREYGAYVVGGDTGEACDLIISVQLFGSAKKADLMLRGGAKAGDILAVTGVFGKTAAGLRLLEDKHLAASATLRDVLAAAVYMPAARLREGLALAGSGAVSSAMDSSDGLAWCLHELSVQSGVGFVVSALPVATEAARFAEVNGLDASELALFGGEEYELVLTVKPELWEKAVSAVEAVGGKLLQIGRATADKRVLLEVNGEKREVAARGYEHFKS